MIQNTNQAEQENQENIVERLRSQQTSHPALSEKENKRLAILNIKADPAFRNELKEGKEGKDKKAQDEFLETIKKGFGNELGATFEDLKITEEEEKERNELLAKTKEEKDREIKKINHELINSVPEDLFEGFDDEKTKREKEERGEYSFPVSLEEMRITLRTGLPEKMRAIFEQFFMLKLDLANWTGNREQDNILASATGGSIVEKHFDSKSGKDKFRITFDPDCCTNNKPEQMENGETVQFTYFSFDKLAYLVTRSILSTIKGENRKKFDEWCKKNGFGENVDKNVKKGSDDWLAMVLSNYEDCGKTIDPKMKDHAEKWLESIKPEDVLKPSELEGPIVISRLDIEERIQNNKMRRPYKDKDTEKHVEPGILLTLLEKTGIFGEAVYSIVESIRNIKIIDRQYINILQAEEDSKEAKKIESRMLSGSEYIPMLKEPQYCNNQAKMRALILTIANKGYWQWWMMQFYLWKFDWKFQSTQGKEIHADSYDFMSRVCKAHQKAVKGPAIAIPEYSIVGNRFIRNSHKKQMEIIDDVLKGLPTRTVQNIASDALEMIMKDGKFIDLDTKLNDQREKYVDKKNPQKHFCATDGKYLEKFMSDKDARNFTGDMQSYADRLDEQEFNNLVGAGIKSVVRRLKRATRVEKEIFSLYTSPILRECYDAYQDKVGEAGYVKEEYEKDFEEDRKELKDAGNDVFEAIDNYSFEELSDIYSKYVKEDSTSPLMRGTEMTARGRLNIFFQQARDKIVHMPKSEIPEHVQDFVTSQIDLLHKKSEITDIDIQIFKKKLRENEGVIKLEPKSREDLNVNINKLLGHMENLGFAKQYSLLFKPFDEKFSSYLPKGKGMETADQEKAKNFFLKNIAPVSSSVRDKLKDITNKFPEITFNSKDIEKIQKLPPQEQNIEIFSILSEKLVERGKPDISRLSADYEKLNQLYWQVSQYVKYSDSSYNLGELAQDFRSLNLIPDSYKKKPINSIETLQKYIKLAKVVVNNYYAEEYKRKQKKKTMGIAVGEGIHSQDMEEEMVAMDEEAAAEEEG